MISSYEIIGDIAVIQVPEGGNEKRIAEQVMKQNKNVKTVAKRTGEVKGKYRIKKVKVVLGEKKTETIHKENNTRLKIDINKAYFSPRLQTERQRIIEKVKPGEVVIDMFAGVGPYAVAIARNKKPEIVYAIDHNPSAIKYLKENITLNKVTNVKAILGDAIEAIRGLPKADRIIMNAPRQNNQKTLNAAKKRVKKGGLIHYYTTSEQVIDLKDLRLLKKRRVIDYAPGKSHLCLDLKLVKVNKG
jgi:tRNA (guanine37-N1)-methyltransferase